MRRFVNLALLIGALAGCTVFRGQPAEDDVILGMGDSIMAWNRFAGQDIPHLIEAQTDLPAYNAAISGAVFLGEDAIPDQLPPGSWDWVIFTGGGNDLRPFCGRPAAARQVIDRLIAPTGLEGAYADFIAGVRSSGARVIILGYAPISDAGGPFAPCASELAELRERQSRLAGALDGVYFVDAWQVISPADLSAYDADLVHPSPAGGLAMTKAIADVIASEP